MVGKDIKNNTITVAPRHFGRSSKMSEQKIVLKNINWNFGEMPDAKKTYTCRIRYRQQKIKCEVKSEKNKIKIIFQEPQMSVSPGQSLVLYDNEICLGGGIIE